MKDIIETVNREKIIAIARNVDSALMKPLAEALLEGGLHLIEVTFDQRSAEKEEDTVRSIELLSKSYPEMGVGAGTVFNERQLTVAKSAGARYILSPHTNLDLVRAIKREGLVAIPGAMTPSECVAAYEAGADFVKLFPAGAMGESYFKAIVAPINHIPFLCVGQITPDNIPRFLTYGARGFGIGGNLVDGKLIAKGDFAEITRRARTFVEAVRSAER